MSVEFNKGEYRTMNITAAADQTAGDVIAGPGTIPGVIFHTDAKTGDLAAVAIGNGTYRGVAAEAIAQGAAVSYVNASGKFAAIGDIAGFVAVSAAGADGDAVDVYHVLPNGA